jgi:K+/H+ antiporter YhaU regulatory subunit KhtT
VVAIVPAKQLIPNPKAKTLFEPGDRIGLIGVNEQINAAYILINAKLSLKLSS